MKLSTLRNTTDAVASNALGCMTVNAIQVRDANAVRTTTGRALSIFLLVSFTCLAGCTDGPFYAMKRANPYFQREFNKDRELGATFEDRLEHLDRLQAKLPQMDSAEQATWATQIEKIISSDPSSEMRARAVATVARMPSEAAVRALNAASVDDVEKVRLAACKAWKLRKDTAARDMLLSLANKSNESTSVRQAALDALSVFGEDATVRTQMTSFLDDPSPAVQYQVAESLKVMTGRDYGGDFASWKQFMAGVDVPEPEPKSMTATILESLPMMR